MLPPVVRLVSLLSIVFLAHTAMALEIRTYSASRHDRFVAGVSGPIVNSGAYYNSSLYTGVAFATNEGDNRQFALVTPQHVLFARHFAFGGNIRFINTDGVAIDRSLGATMEVPNGSGGISDAIIMKLSAPLTKSDKITPFPYLNLSSEAAYTGTVLTTFGQNLRAGRGVISSFSNFSGSGIDSTRSFTFSYSTFGGNRDDSYAVGGDSGSPTFATANGRPALVGMHLAAGQGTFSNSSIDTFVPQYASTINGLLASEGYQLIPAYPASVTLSAGETHDPLRQAFPGAVDISLSNTSAATATNVRLNLTFPTGAVPDSISAPGWIVENPSPGQYNLRTATMDGNASSTLTASYASLPNLTDISIDVLHRSDGSPELSQTLDLPVQATFAAFVAGLSLKGQTDDPDLDGFTNLIEYAFGGDPGTASALASGGQMISPVTILENGDVRYFFPRRTDAAERGLEYEIEFSENLEDESWTTTPPSGFNLSSDNYDPDSPGFEMVTATLPAGSPDKNFLRVKVTLTE